MFFKDIKTLKIEEILKDYEKIWAHTKENISPESLHVHCKLSVEYFFRLCKVKNLDEIFKNIQSTIFSGCSKECIALWKEVVVNTIYLHDIGKSNVFFQVIKMKNPIESGLIDGDTKHSKYSACLMYYLYKDRIYELEPYEQDLIYTMLSISAYVIDRHHSSLSDLNDKLNEIDKELRNPSKKVFGLLNKEIEFNDSNIKDMMSLIRDDLREENQWLCINMYVYTRFLYSLVVASDYYATAEYMIGKPIKDFGVIDDVKKYRNCYDETDVSKSIKEYLKCQDTFEKTNKKKFELLNALRSEMFIESDINIKNNTDNDIFFLPAPTGAGKTNMSINLALRLIEKNSNINRIYYTFPFNNLVEQTKSGLQDTFKNNEYIKNNIVVVNSLTAMKEEKLEENSDEIDFEKTYLDRQFLHYPITISTHVALFNILFGTKKSNLFPLVHLCNSVVIIDEIQSYKNSIWKEIIVFLKAYARILNLKIIIMSATLPDLSVLSVEKDGFVELIQDSNRYFEDPLFANRVKLNYSLIDIKKDLVFEKIFEKAREHIVDINNNKNRKAKVLIEFISKKSAKSFYEFISQQNQQLGDTKVILFTGDDNLLERAAIIKDIKGENEEDKEQNIILVATQVVEAGVDIDMDIGFKDFSLLDNDEQFLGRINRNNKKTGCVAYFFNYDDPKDIYKNDIRAYKEYTLLNIDIRNILEKKDFGRYYGMILKEVEKNKNMNNRESFNKFVDDNLVKDMSFKEIEKKMELIENIKSVRVFVNRAIELPDKNILDGEIVWGEYCELLINKQLGNSEKKVKVSQINEKMQNFVYEIKLYFNKSLPSDFDDRLKYGMFYIDNGYEYVEDGKVNIDKISEYIFGDKLFY